MVRPSWSENLAGRPGPATKAGRWYFLAARCITSPPRGLYSGHLTSPAVACQGAARSPPAPAGAQAFVPPTSSLKHERRERGKISPGQPRIDRGHRGAPIIWHKGEIFDHQLLSKLFLVFAEKLQEGKDLTQLL